MIRYLVGILISIFVLTLLKGIIGIVMRGASEVLNPKPTADAGPRAANRPPEKGTMLRKCRGCGTFAPEPSMLRISTKEADVFFCSKECEKKAAAA